MPKVFIVEDHYGVDNMFRRMGWKVVNSSFDADLIQFTGGADISPSLYGEEKHPRTYVDNLRDAYECNIFYQEDANKPKAGICRGGQLLNALSGGGMWQHVSNHGIHGYHIGHTNDGKKVPITSVHHQMMEPKGQYDLLMWSKEATYKERGDGSRHIPDEEEIDVEAVYYPSTNSFCYQPHPEFVSLGDPCQEWYFDELERLWGLRA